MIRLRLSSPFFRAALAGSLLPCLLATAHAQRSVRTTVQTTTSRYESRASGADDSIHRGDANMIRQDYERAVADYRSAVDALPDAPATADRRKVALKKFFDASIKLSDQRVLEGRYVDAETVLKVVLRPEYDPSYKPVIIKLQRLEDPEYYNQTVTPKHIEKVQQVKDLLLQAQGFYDSGRYDLAFKRYDQVLSLDPYNNAARKGQERVDLQKARHGDPYSYDEARGRLLGEVDQDWGMPVRKQGLEVDPRRGSRIQRDDVGNAAITRKLASIIIPNIEFHSTTISDAIEYLRQESRRLDTDPDADSRGVNIFLKLPGAGGAAPRSVAPVVDPTAAIPGLPAGAGDAGASTAPVTTATANTRITLTLGRIPLLEALKYVASQAGLKVKVEPYAVSIVPVSEQTDVMVTADFHVPPNFISNSTSGGGIGGGPLNQGATTAGTGSGGTTTDASGAGGVTISRQDAKTFLEASGVTFPPGASATYLPSTSKLVVRNTQENVDLIESLVAEQQTIIKQVEIESKFIEITQDNLKELSFDWTLGQANIPGSSKAFFGGGTSGSGRSISSADFPFNNTTTGSVVGSTAITAGNRTGTYGISANAIDALLFGGAGAAAAPGIFSVAGVFSDPQFQLVVRALNQQKGVDLLSAPRVTTKSGQKATIEIIREFIYPTQFQPPQIPQNFGNNNGGSFISNPLTGLVQSGGSNGSFPVTPTTPTNFEKRNTGVTLEVEPVIGPDNFTIDLNLQPQVVEFDGFINYGSPIQTTSTNILGISTTNVITPNVINQPIFDTRKVSTSVSVYDGSTVVLGGLVREDIQKVNDKVPILGDVPLVGRLFRSKIDQNIKRNLIIFVTAHLIDPSGQLITNIEDEEEVVQPLNGPDSYVQPTGPLPNYGKK